MKKSEAIATKCDCPVNEIRVGEIKKRSPRALGAVWVQCPSTVAKILADAGRITIGWIAARIEALRARPMTCFRCMERGHTARNCTSEQDRSKQCYNCGSEGHQAKACSATPCCPVCSTDGRPAKHRFGGKSCNPPKNRRTSGARNETAATNNKQDQRKTENASDIQDKDKATTSVAQESGLEEAMEVTE